MHEARVSEIAAASCSGFAGNGQAKSVIAEAESCLRRNGVLFTASIVCSYREDDRTLTISGRVRTYYQKQMAQAAVRLVDGVERIANDLEVIPPTPRFR